MRGAWVVGAALVLAACTATVPSALVDGPAPDSPYAGPLSVATRAADGVDVLARSGAAGRALECDGRPFRGGVGEYRDGLASVQKTPEKALQAYVGVGVGQVPAGGYRVEREDADRVLLSFDVDRRSKIAFIVLRSTRDDRGDLGWGVETWAQCDPSELPERESARLGFQVWRDPQGRRLPVTTIQSFGGADHCGWEDVTFLTLGEYGKGPSYVRDRRGVLAASLTAAYDGAAELPSDATDSGYRRGGRQLWLVKDASAAYLVHEADRSDVERWPAARETIWCA